METATAVLNRTIATLGVPRATPTQPLSSAGGPSVKLPSKPFNPLLWQDRWLGLQRHHPSVSRAMEAAMAHCQRWFRNERQSETLLVLFGSNGSGKTMIGRGCYRWAAAVAIAAWQHGFWRSRVPSVGFHRWPEVADEIRAKRLAILEDLEALDFLVLDDIGAEKDDWKEATEKLCQVLTRRERMFTLVTTNVLPGEWATRFDLRVKDRLLRRAMGVDMSDVPSWAEVA